MIILPQTNSKKSYTLSELAETIGGKVDGDGSLVIHSAAPIETASNGDITFIANEKYLKHLNTTEASAIILDEQVAASNLSIIRHNNPYLAFALVLDILYPELPDVNSGIAKSAIIEKNTTIDSTARIGELCHIRSLSKIGKQTRLISSVFIGKNVVIGDNCILYPGVRIMDDCQIGNNVIIHASTVIGSDGFGYAESELGLKKIKQIGNVVIEDNVEFGSNCSVDRGALGPTVIGMGTKIDNLVQIAHNVRIGRHAIIVAQAGVAGSTIIGNGVVLAGQVGVAGHLEIGDGAMAGGQSGVIKSVKAGTKVFGTPAREIMKSKRIEALLNRLPEMLKRIKKLEEK
ncbi:MAG TPA: UDP-3-O-(3-hydroxymyristoyl)glucosamine N-acyltransferase [candidate division Zixibacteria bacterium]|nr:UDP-3-O-(3-hydroxymyristoyl)glucosamine N-acyltransferase [candidate division Zixibacteria bacterium]